MAALFIIITEAATQRLMVHILIDIIDNFIQKKSIAAVDKESC